MKEKEDLNEVEVGVRLKTGFFKRNIYIDKEDISLHRKMYQNTGVYVTAYCYEDASNKKEDSLLYGHLYLDFDCSELKDESIEDEAFELIREDGIRAVGFLDALMGVDPDTIKIYYSGQKGIHMIIPAKTFGIKPQKELNHVFKMIANDIFKMSKNETVDTKIYDNARLLSLPGSVHPSTGRYKTAITLDELRRLPFKEIKDLSTKKRKIKHKPAAYSTKANRMFKGYQAEWEREKLLKNKKGSKKGKKTLNFMPPCIEDILSRPSVEGSRNHTATALTSYFKSRGFSKENAWLELKKWNSEYAKLPVSELSTTFESIFEGEYTYGCSTLETLGECCKNKCRIGIQRTKKEKEALLENKK